MPEQVSSSIPQDVEVRALSNSVDDMITPGIGPDQSHCRVNICEYIHFDYAGSMKDDPVISVHMNLTPLDGSNDGKDFDIEWTVGPKASEVLIIDEGGKLAPGPGGKGALSNTSNWANLQKSMKDASFDPALLNGPTGIRFLQSMEWVIRRIKQVERSGLDSKNSKGRDKEFYTCLKIEKMPGESKPTTRRATGTSTRAAASTPAPAQAATASTQAATNGASAPSPELVGFIKSALESSGGSLKLSELGKLVFQAAKAAGKTGKEATDLGKLSMSPAFLDENPFENGWDHSADTGTLSLSS